MIVISYETVHENQGPTYSNNTKVVLLCFDFEEYASNIDRIKLVIWLIK